LLGRDQPHQIRIQEHRVAAVVAGGYSEIDAREGSVAVIDQDEVTVLDARGRYSAVVEAPPDRRSTRARTRSDP
jgi:hypothetical protein